MFLSICIVLAALPVVRTKITFIHLTNDNFVSLRGPVTSQSIAELISNLLDKTSDERYIYLNTNGGSVDAGMHLINVIKDLENNNIKVNCIADTAISMGFVIFQSCSKRYVLSYSTLMQHQMSLSGIKGKLLELNSYMSHINKIEDTVNKMQANRINITQSEFESRINNDWWLTSDESIEFGVADELVSIKCMFPKEKEIVEINTMFGDVVLTYLKCPQISTPIKVETKLIKNDEKTNILDIINSNFINLNKLKPKEFVEDKFSRLKNINSNTNYVFSPHIFDRFIDIVGVM
jgi:ATP-dependent Clp protease protease subunit